MYKWYNITVGYPCLDSHIYLLGISYFLKMLGIFSSAPFYTNFVHQPQSTDFPSLYIVDNPKFHPFFENAIGGIDGSHFISSGTAEERALAHDCKGLTTTNCLAWCDFDHNFTYLFTGWEGSVSDSMMFFDSHITDLRIKPGKFYLADAGFPVASALLIPYRDVWYHLAELGHADLWCVAFHYKYCYNAYSLLAQPIHRSSLIFTMHQLKISLRGCLVSWRIGLKSCNTILISDPKYKHIFLPYLQQCTM